MCKKRKYLIDGRFLASMKTGIDRYAYQIINELDKICDGLDISILVPGNAQSLPQYRNIRVITEKNERLWTQAVFGGYARLHNMTPVNLCNEVSVIAKKGIVCLHDVCYVETKEYYPGVTEFDSSEIEWFKKLYRRIVKKTGRLITVSEFSKCRIEELLNVPPDKIDVIGNGRQHFNSIKTDRALLDRYEKIKEGQYYFTLTSANKNKNVDWVLEASKVNPDDIFVIAGKGIDRFVDFNKYNNVVYTGFASDELAKTLMKYCKAFIFPSYYEGFGIPPLEALSTGCQVIVSDAASLPEIFGSAAYYISPDNPYVNLDELIRQPVTAAQEVLEKYSWAKSAGQLYSILKDY